MIIETLVAILICLTLFIFTRIKYVKAMTTPSYNDNHIINSRILKYVSVILFIFIILLIITFVGVLNEKFNLFNYE